MCTDGLGAALLIKLFNPTTITFAHSHYDDLAANKIRKIISNNYQFKNNLANTVLFSDTTISKFKFVDFLSYLQVMIPTEFEKFQTTTLDIIFQDHHLEPMAKVITQISYFNHTIDDLS